MTQRIRIDAVVERHHPRMPRYVVVPGTAVAKWKLEGTTVVKGKVNGVPLGRRSLKRWGDERWFIDLPDGWCRRAGVESGDHVEVSLEIASADLPEELAQLVSGSLSAKDAWGRMTASHQRMLREHVLAARRPETRARRARKGLGLDCSRQGGVPDWQE